MSDIQLFNCDCIDHMKTMENKSYDLAIFDPPYAIGEAAGKNKSRSNLAVAKDYGNKDWDDKRISKKHFDEVLRVSKNQIIFGGNYYTDYLYPSPCWIVWHKDNGGNDFADCELAWCSFKTAVRYKRFRWSGMLQEDMKNKEIREHPTQKPVGLLSWIIRKYSKPGDTIFDPMMGAGSTGIACHNLNRNFTGCELDLQYFQIAKKRIEDTQKQQRLFEPPKPKPAEQLKL